MPAATVLIPTHDHGPLLCRAVESALGQTMSDIEVLIIGDGVPATTRDLVGQLSSEDSRVRFFDFPKGARHGETHRHEVLAHARGDVVCYLADDDLWLPDHVADMTRQLSHADFTHALPVWIGADGELQPYPIDLSLTVHRQRLLKGHNLIGLTCAAHTMDAYRRTAGWRTTPTGMPTDLYMWMEYLADPSCRIVSGACPTALLFPSPLRRTWTLEARAAELDEWLLHLADPRWRTEFQTRIAEATTAHAVRLETQRLDLIDAVERLRGTLPWRIWDRLTRLPGLGAVLRTAAKARELARARPSTARARRAR